MNTNISVFPSSGYQSEPLRRALNAMGGVWTPQEVRFGRALDLTLPQLPVRTNGPSDVVTHLEQRGFRLTYLGYSEQGIWHFQVFNDNASLPDGFDPPTPPPPVTWGMAMRQRLCGKS